MALSTLADSAVVSGDKLGVFVKVKHFQQNLSWQKARHQNLTYKLHFQFLFLEEDWSEFNQI